ncbi:putative reverse transcriptase domain-containing protein [Tanacetum coccineum]
MSDSEHSTVTYTSVSIPVEDDSDIGSPRINGPPIMPEDPYAYIMAAYQVPPSPDYIPGPEVPPSPDYIPGPEEDEILPAEEQPLPAAASPTTDSPGYIRESDLEEEPEEDDEDPKEDPADDPADREDDDDDDDDEDKDEEEEHPAPADSIPPVHRMTARISIRDEPSISLPPREEVERLLALTTPPPSPLTPLSSPLPQIPSPPLPIPSPPPNSPTHIEIPESCLPLRKRVRFASPTPSHEVGESSAAGAARQDRPAIARDDPYSIAREDLYGFVDMVDVPPRCSTSRELDYGITDTWDDLVGAIDEIAPTTLEGVNQRVTDLATIVEEETTIMYGIMEDAQDDRSQLRGRVNLLYRDRPVHRRLAVMIEREAKMAREAWGLSMDASDYARSDVMSLRTTVVAQSALISELQSADHRRQRTADHRSQTVTSEMLQADHMRQAEIAALRTFDRDNTAGTARTLWGSSTASCTGGGRCFDVVELPLLSEERDEEARRLVMDLKVEKGSVVASKPKTMQEATEMASELMDKKINTIAERQAENKRKFDDTSKNNQNHPQHNKRQNTGRAYTAGSGDKKYVNLGSNQRGNGTGQGPTCFECGVRGYFKTDCPKLKNNNNNRGNQVRNANAPAKVYAVGHAGTNPDSNVVRGTFLLNNRYASILFDTSVDRSFVSTAFSSQIDITPSTLDHYYDDELADGRIIRLNTILKGCTLNLLNHPFNINLMPVELGSFDAIIGMDWLAKYQAIIVCAEKIVRIPWGNETLIVHGDGSNRRNETRLNIISCTKTQKYFLKGCPIFLGILFIRKRREGTKSEENAIEVTHYRDVRSPGTLSIGVFSEMKELLRICKVFMLLRYMSPVPLTGGTRAEAASALGDASGVLVQSALSVLLQVG